MVLESHVERKYYLSEKTIDRILKNANVLNSAKGRDDTAYALGSNDWKGVGNKAQRNIIKEDIDYVVSSDKKDYRVISDEGIAPSVQARSDTHKIREGRMNWIGREAVFNITPGSGKEQPIPEADRIYQVEGIAPPVKANDVKIIHNIYGGFNEGHREFEDYSPTIRTPGGGGHLPMVRSVAYRTRNYRGEDGHIEVRQDDVANQLTTVQKDSMVEDGYTIRRLTPIECERLQGFPDGWTKLGLGNIAISDTQRYKMLGNAVTVNVVEAIARRFLEVGG